MKKQSYFTGELGQRFSFRKYLGVGLCSVALGTMFLSANGHQVKADTTTDGGNTNSAVAKSDDSDSGKASQPASVVKETAPVTNATDVQHNGTQSQASNSQAGASENKVKQAPVAAKASVSAENSGAGVQGAQTPNSGAQTANAGAQGGTQTQSMATGTRSGLSRYAFTQLAANVNNQEQPDANSHIIKKNQHATSHVHINYKYAGQNDPDEGAYKKETGPLAGQEYKASEGFDVDVEYDSDFNPTDNSTKITNIRLTAKNDPADLSVTSDGDNIKYTAQFFKNDADFYKYGVVFQRSLTIEGQEPNTTVTTAFQGDSGTKSILGADLAKSPAQGALKDSNIDINVLYYKRPYKMQVQYQTGDGSTAKKVGQPVDWGTFYYDDAGKLTEKLASPDSKYSLLQPAKSDVTIGMGEGGDLTASGNPNVLGVDSQEGDKDTDPITTTFTVGLNINQPVDYIDITHNNKVVGQGTPVTGSEGQIIQYEPKAPEGYELVDPAPTVPVQITNPDKPVDIHVKPKQAPVTDVTQPIHYVDVNDPNKTTLASDSVTGPKDSHQPYDPTKKVPNGYELTPDGKKMTSIPITDGKTPVEIPVQAIKIDQPVQYVDVNDKTKTFDGGVVTGPKGSKQAYDPTAKLPSGYELTDQGKQMTSIIVNDSKNPVQIPIQKIPVADVNQPVHYVDVDNGNKVVGTDTVTGPKGSKQPYDPTKKVPDGYELTPDGKNVTSVPITDGTTPTDIPVKKIPAANVNQPVHYVDVDDGNKVVGSDTVTGPKGSKQPYDPTKKVPDGYELTPDGKNVTSVPITDGTTPTVIPVKKIPATDVNQPVHYVDVDNGNKVVGTDTVTGPKGSKQPYDPTKKVPDGYELTPDGKNVTSVPITDGKTPTNIPVKKIPAADVNQPVHYVDVDDGNKVVGSDTVTGPKGSKQPYDPTKKVPDGYELTPDGKNVTSVPITDGTTPVDIPVKKTEINQPVDYVDGNNVVGHGNPVKGPKGSKQPYDPANNVPKGYELTDEGKKMTQIPVTDPNTPVKIPVKPVSPDDITQPIHYVDVKHDNKVVGQDHVTGPKGSDQPFTPNIPDGYEPADPSKVPSKVTVTDPNTPVDIPVVPIEKGQTVNYVDPSDPDHPVKTDHINPNNKKGDNVPFTPDIPDGWVPVDPSKIPDRITVNPDQPLNIPIKHGTVEVNKPMNKGDIVPGTKGNKMDQDINDNDLNKQITRTIVMNMPNGTVKDEVQVVTAHRAAIVDQVTGKIIGYTPYKGNKGGYDEYVVPDVPGYTPTQKVVPAEKVDPNTAKDEVVVINYKKNPTNNGNHNNGGNGGGGSITPSAPVQPQQPSNPSQPTAPTMPSTPDVEKPEVKQIPQEAFHFKGDKTPSNGPRSHGPIGGGYTGPVANNGGSSVVAAPAVVTAPVVNGNGASEVAASPVQAAEASVAANGAQAQALPQTGSANSLAVIALGMALVGLSLGVAVTKKREA